MGLSVNTNIAALNAYRNLSNTQSSLNSSLEKLSSGLRINRAADDAAGLSISEGLRSQISGTNQAVRNAQDGISVVQTAEGALTETHSILQRMRTLSVQAANDGGLSADAKTSIQSEMDELTSELDRISSTTQFNGTKLLDGTYASSFQVGANTSADDKISVTIGDMSASALAVDTLDVTTAGTPASTTINTYATYATTGTYADATALQGLGTVTVNGVNVDLSAVTGQADINTALSNAGAGATATWSAGTAITFTSTTSAAAADITSSIAGTATAGTSTTTPAVPSGAESAINAIDAAITSVSSQRSSLGAIQNRFDHTINNLNVAAENLTASESRIRDTDMAAEMVNYTRSSILSQAGTAMLAQAKSLPQSVLQLLQ
ncbi:flagellin [Actinotalea sp. M2MS4P-6]|uniref:flagellin N-terminal helical domain-containing protein n=1 Tax=Actinotalea sp. M2MS4P-6 TaxID=2983762 RepID=UPI0021E458D4|nr:flagellin [Actinotalea sp. M2MS4P-6]MCV2392797.1 flagellin [Actinotalea sp. M2MS4P-6]